MDENRFYWKDEPGLFPAIDDPFNMGPEQLRVRKRPRQSSGSPEKRPGVGQNRCIVRRSSVSAKVKEVSPCKGIALAGRFYLTARES